MSNANLIERLRSVQNECAQYAVGSDIIRDSADALELADKRIDELKQLVEDERENAREWKLSSSAATDKLADAERKLAAARDELLRCKRIMLRECGIGVVDENVLAQIGGVTPADPQSTPLTRGSKSADS